MKNKYFNITKGNGTLEKMELILDFKLQQFNKNYIFYKSVNDNDVYYAASYEEEKNEGYSNLDTNLSEEEKEILNGIFKKFLKGDDVNA